MKLFSLDKVLKDAAASHPEVRNPTDRAALNRGSPDAERLCVAWESIWGRCLLVERGPRAASGSGSGSGGYNLGSPANSR